MIFIVQLRNVLLSEGSSYSVLSFAGCKFRGVPWSLVEFKLLYISAAQMRIQSSFFRFPVKLPSFRDTDRGAGKSFYFFLVHGCVIELLRFGESIFL